MISYLLDTHTFLWALFEPEKLSEKVRALILNSQNTVYVSSVSFWEISIKYSLGKIAFEGVNPAKLTVFAQKMGFTLLALEPEIAATVHNLKGTWHQDPFDRLLIWQAINESLTILSKDSKVSLYKDEGLQVVW